MQKVLLVGKSGRVHILADALTSGRTPIELSSFSEIYNPGLVEKCKEMETGATDNVEEVAKFAAKVKPDFAVIGPEEPLAAGIVDKLRDQLGIPCIGPTKKLARIESSKSFTRELLTKYGIPGNPMYRVFRNLDGLKPYLESQEGYVLKPDGLTGGKGVKVSGEHFHSSEEALEYCKLVIDAHKEPVVVEEKLDGEEFSLQSFCDGQHIVDMVVAQDHKRAFPGDEGPNTGGMGSYSCEDHRLPFLSKEQLQEASDINRAVFEALGKELGEEYKGILYGGFMLTKKGVQLIEYNARFGDPEIMNVLSVLETDFVDICHAIIDGTLNRLPISFKNKATVCLYVVPKGYPTNPEKDRLVAKSIPKSSKNLKVYYGAVNEAPDGLFLTGSRAIAFVGIGDTIQEAQEIACDAASKVKGTVRYRGDIGSQSLLNKRVEHMNRIMAENSPSPLVPVAGGTR